MNERMNELLRFGDVVRPELMPGLVGMGLTENQERLVCTFMAIRQAMEELLRLEGHPTLAATFTMMSDHVGSGDPEEFLDHPLTQELQQVVPKDLHGLDRQKLLLGMLATKLALRLNERMHQIKPADLAQA